MASKIILEWAMDYACHRRMPGVIHALATEDMMEILLQKMSPESPDLSDVSIRFMLITIHTMIKDDDIEQYGIVLKLIEDLFTAFGNNIPFKIYAKSVTGLKILILFDQLKKDPTHSLDKLDLFFPPEGYSHPLVPVKTKATMTTAQHMFRNFYVPMIKDKEERNQYLATGIKDDFGPSFYTVLRKHIDDFVRRIENMLPKTMITTLLEKPEILEDFMSDPSPIIKQFGQILHQKENLTEDDVLKLAEAIRSYNEMIRKRTTSEEMTESSLDISLMGIIGSGIESINIKPKPGSGTQANSPLSIPTPERKDAAAEKTSTGDVCEKSPPTSDKQVTHGSRELVINCETDVNSNAVSPLTEQAESERFTQVKDKAKESLKHIQEEESNEKHRGGKGKGAGGGSSREEGYSRSEMSDSFQSESYVPEKTARRNSSEAKEMGAKIQTQMDISEGENVQVQNRLLLKRKPIHCAEEPASKNEKTTYDTSVQETHYFSSEDILPPSPEIPFPKRLTSSSVFGTLRKRDSTDKSVSEVWSKSAAMDSSQQGGDGGDTREDEVTSTTSEPKTFIPSNTSTYSVTSPNLQEESSTDEEFRTPASSPINPSTPKLPPPSDSHYDV